MRPLRDVMSVNYSYPPFLRLSYISFAASAAAISFVLPPSDDEHADITGASKVKIKAARHAVRHACSFAVILFVIVSVTSDV